MADALADNHKRIWLDPLCCIDERCWHVQRPENCCDCELAPIGYVRADLVEALIVAAEAACETGDRRKLDALDKTAAALTGVIIG